MDIFETFAAIGTAISIISSIIGLISIISTWILFKKAGKPGWFAIIPIVNIWVLFDIVWGNGIYMFLLLIPFVNFVIAIMANIKLAKAFGKDAVFGLLLTFVSFIALPMLAFGNSTYIGPQ